MKKTNKLTHFITTALSLLLMLAVLSTATYAWYTVVNRASGNSITFTAAINEGGGDLAIGWSIADTTSFSLNFDEPDNSLYPMIPRNMPIINTTLINDFVIGNFNSSNQTKNTLEEWICSVAGQNVNPHICSGNSAVQTQNYFYLINRNDTYDLEVSVIYDIVGADLGNKLRVAMFVGTTPINQVFKGIMSNNEFIHYGDIVQGQKVSEIPIMTGAYKPTTEIIFRIPKGEPVLVTLVAWLDGVIMTDDDAEKEVSFGIRFDGIAIQ